MDTSLNILLEKSTLKKIQFGDFAYFLNGYAFKSDSYLPEGKYRILTIGNVQDGKITYDPANFINELPKNIPEHCILAVGDILMSLTGYVGRIAIVTKDNCLLNQRVCKIKPKKDYYLAGIVALMRCEKVQRSMNTMSEGGTAQQNLSAVELSNTEFDFISLEQFETFCVSNKKIISTYLNNLNIIEELTKISKLLISSLSSKR